jgi:excisionase family DNA binding protein
MDIQRPLGINEAAEFTGLSKAYLYKLTHLGKIPYYKPTGGKVYFKIDDLEKFVFSGRQSTEAELREQAEAILLHGGKARSR